MFSCQNYTSTITNDYNLKKKTTPSDAARLTVFFNLSGFQKFFSSCHTALLGLHLENTCVEIFDLISALFF